MDEEETMLTRGQVAEIAAKAEKIRIFAADYQKYELWESSTMSALCATVRELRELVADTLECRMCTGFDRDGCAGCKKKTRIEEALR